jgi:hypothetical protein
MTVRGRCNRHAVRLCEVEKASGFSTIDVPGVIQNCNFGINSSGEIVGIYQSVDGKFHGYLLTTWQ